MLDSNPSNSDADFLLQNRDSRIRIQIRRTPPYITGAHSLLQKLIDIKSSQLSEKLRSITHTRIVHVLCCSNQVIKLSNKLCVTKISCANVYSERALKDLKRFHFLVVKLPIVQTSTLQNLLAPNSRLYAKGIRHHRRDKDVRNGDIIGSCRDVASRAPYQPSLFNEELRSGWRN